MAHRRRQCGYVVPTGVPTDAVGGARHVVSVMVQLMERCAFQRVYHWLVHRWSSRVGCTAQGTLGGSSVGYVPWSGHLVVTFRLVTRGDSRGRDQGVCLTQGGGWR